VQLRRKTLTGWKILEKECPRCKLEWEDRRKARSDPAKKQLTIENEHGAQVAFDKRGACVRHSDVQLRRKTLLGWKILEKECPRCAMEWEDHRKAQLGGSSKSVMNSSSVSTLTSSVEPSLYSQSLDPTIQSHVALSSLLSTAREQEDAKLQLNTAFEADDIAGVLSIMRKYSQSASVQGVGCKALWRLGLRYGKASKVLEHGGKGVIEQAVSKHAHRDDDIAGHGPLLLKLLNRGTSEPELRFSATNPLSSLPPVDSRVERIVVDDIQYLAKHNALDRLLLLLRWFPHSSVIQGTGCKEIFGLISQAQEGAVVFDRGDQQVIKDAMHYFGAIDDDVAEYGSMVLSMCASTAPAPAPARLMEQPAADINAADKNGDSWLRDATGSENDEMELVTHLVDKAGLVIDAVNNSGGAPLHDATGSENNKLRIVQFLVEKAGADIHAVTNDGETPLDLATIGGYAGSSQVAAYLKSEMTTSRSVLEIPMDDELLKAARS
jgi:Ankyrin repeat